MNNEKDYAYLKFYNPDKEDWNILYSAWYSTTKKDWIIYNIKYYKPMIMRIWFLKNTKTYNITTIRDPFNTNWDENWINPWFWDWLTNWKNQFVYKDNWNWESNVNSVLNKANNDLLSNANYNWRKLNWLLKSFWENRANLDNLYPTSFYDKAWNWYSIQDSVNWLKELTY